jgi:hypothetical protein
MHSDGHERVTLDLDPQSERIAGSLIDERGTRTPFSGWLTLARLLERARNRSDMQQAGQPTDPPGKD